MGIEARKLLLRRRMFVEYYIRGEGYPSTRLTCGRKAPVPRLNATAAARRAGYAHPKQQGPRLVKNPQVRRAVVERLHEMGIYPEQILLRMFEVATANMGDFAPVFEETSLTGAVSKAKELGISHLIRSIRVTKAGVELELYDAHKARVLLGRRMGLWK